MVCKQNQMAAFSNRIVKVKDKKWTGLDYVSWSLTQGYAEPQASAVLPPTKTICLKKVQKSVNLWKI